MGRSIPRQILDEIRNAADIVDIVSDVVMLKKAGKNYVGLCPFHAEKTPSFSVSPDKQMYYCFGCGAGGNAIGFLMAHEGVSFPEAARLLARRCGIEIPDETLSEEEMRAIREKERLLDINRRAAAFYREVLRRRPDGEAARDYLNRRGMTEEMLDRFSIGYAPEGWDFLLKHFGRKGIDSEILEKAGLIVPRKSGAGHYDRFRGRVMLPIENLMGQIIGFGGRVLNDDLPKYLNSPETPLFDKKRCLYGIKAARQECRRTNRAFLVEGYFDVISLHGRGITNAMATLGTALSEAHVRLIRGHARDVVLVFDSDAAGVQAALRSVGVFQKEQMDARIMILPEGHDPDTYVREHGRDAFEKAADNAMEMMAFLMECMIRKHGDSVSGKLRTVNEMIPSLNNIEDAMARSLYIRKLAERLQVPHETVMAKVRDRTGPRPNGYRRQPVRNPAEAGGTKYRLEAKLIAMMLQMPEMNEEIASRQLLNRFENETLKSIGTKLLECRREAGTNASGLLDHLLENERRIAAHLAMKKEKWDPEGCYRLLSQYESGKSGADTLLRRIEQARQNNDHDLLMKLLAEKQRSARLKALDHLNAQGGKA